MMSKILRKSPVRSHWGVCAAAIVATGLSYVPPADAQENQALAPAALVEALRDGGHVVFIRHATTERDYADQVDAVMGDCASQRVLSAAGWAEAKAIGAAFARLSIPVGEVISSEYCRAWQTADLAFGQYRTSPNLNFEPAEDYTDAQIATMRAQMTPYLAGVPQADNLVLVGHDDPFEAATGIYPEPMGIVFVLRPLGEGRFDILGTITPDGWADIP